MATMGTYCKAYPIARFREFSGWIERREAFAPPDQEDGSERPEGGEPEYLFLQENLVVTDSVFMDENIVFDAVTPEWKTFCHDVLEFEVPEYEVKTVAPAAETEDSHASLA